MQDTPAVLLLDDGELLPVAELLDRSEIAYRRLRRSEIGEEVGPPSNLLISTPRHASKVRPGSPPGAAPGRPVRIIAVEEDSPALRRMLRTMGFHLLVRLPVHIEVWRLLIQRALYQGDERRRDTRLPMGSQISVASVAAKSATTRENRESLLVDISNRGCHFIGDEPFESGTRVTFSLDATTTGCERLDLSGEILRTGPWQDGDATRYSCAMVFDADLDDASLSTLARMINSRISGPLSLAPKFPAALSLPSCDSRALPGLKLDDETDPPVSTDCDVQLSLTTVAPSETEPDERRKDRRGDYLQRIEVQSDGVNSILMGRDLSSSGMRVERFGDMEIGAHLRLALYGPSDAGPIQVEAEIVRDDGDRGIALHFCNLSRESSALLEKFVACLPPVESLEDGEALGMGTVLAEAIPADKNFNRS